MRRHALLLALALAACGACRPAPSPRATNDASTDAEGGELVVYATEYPVAYFAERLVAGLGRVVCPVPEGEDPIHWEPTRDVLDDFRAASLVVTNGAGFARWIENASLPESRLVRTADGFQDEFLHFEVRTHSHGPGGEHTHSGLDPHTWLDPVNARRQAEAIAEALAARLPSERARIDANLAELRSDLEALEAEWRTLDGPLEGVTLLANHRAYDYLLRRFGWAATSLDLAPDAAPTAEALADVRGARVEGTRHVMLWESEPRAEVRARLASELGVESVVVPPAEILSAKEREAGEDYLGLQRAAIDRLRAALAP